MNEPHDPLDRLQDAVRVRGATRMFSDQTIPESVDHDQALDVIQHVLDYLTKTGLTRSAVAKSIGVSAATLGLVLNDSYKGNWQRVILDLDRWLEDQQRRDAAPKAGRFVWTKVAEEIRTVAEMAITLETIGLITGPNTSGFGKTITLQTLLSIKPGSILVTAEKATCTFTGLVRAIARAIPVSDSGPAGLVYQRVKEKLAGSKRLLMVDQVHTLCGARDDLPLYTLIDLYNGTCAPQLWSGTADLIAYLNRGVSRGQQSLAQIFSRIGIRRDLTARAGVHGHGGGDPLYTTDEIREIFGRGKMRLAPDAARYLMELANLPDSGALRTCSNLVKMATKIHEDDGSQLTAAMLRSAFQLLVGRSAELVEDKLSALQAPSMAKVG